jgi:hypothetical protein
MKINKIWPKTKYTKEEWSIKNQYRKDLKNKKKKRKEA